MRRMRGDSNAAIGLVVVLIVAMIIVAIAVGVVLIPWKTVNVDEERNVSKTAGIEQMSVSITSTTGAVEVSFDDLVDDLAQFSVKGSGRLNLLTSSPPVVVNLTSSPSANGKVLNVQGEVKIDALGGAFSFSDLTIRMVLDRSIPSRVNVLSEAGHISLTTGAGVVLNGANLQTTAGTIAMSLGEGTNLTGNVTMLTTAGAVALTWNEVMVNGQPHVNLGATTGAVEANITQHGDMGGNVTLNAIATTGSVTFAMDISDGNAARIETASGFDNVNVRKSVGFTGSNDQLSSTNYLGPQETWFYVVLSVTTGSIDLSAQYAI